MPATNGDDLLVGNGNGNNINGLGGDDEIYGRGGGDLLYGDSIGGPYGHDEVYGEDGDDWISGEGGNDELRGGKGEDYVAGGAGNDELYGGKHDDHLTGLSGEDRIAGGLGNDAMFGGGHADTFVFETMADFGTNQDRIGDFVPHSDLFDPFSDVIDLSQIDAIAGGGANQAFTFVEDGFTGAGQIRAFELLGNTFVQLNNDADAAAEAMFRIDGTGLFLDSADFIL